MDHADLFRPISLGEIRQEYAIRTFRAHSIASLAD